MFTSILLGLGTLSCIRAAPILSNETVGWVQSPNGRGTGGIITSCVLTLSLCVWSAMHLSIPKKAESRVEYWARNLKWILLGILIPELVVLSAWRQWLSAKSMTKQMKEILGKENDCQKREGNTSSSSLFSAKPPERRHPWTFVHSLYAGMGGFVFDMSLLPQGDDAFIPDRERLTLTTSGVILLARCGYLPDLGVTEIKDKSKADSIAKALVCLQAGWMVVQTIGRIIVREPVTLLEVNTLGHVFCAFVIYLLWWQKPREVYEPTVLQGEALHPICAYMYMSSRLSGRKPNRKIQLSSWRKPELAERVWFGGRRSSVRSDQMLTLNENNMETSVDISADATGLNPPVSIPGESGPRPDNEGCLGPRPSTDKAEASPTVIKRMQSVPLKGDTLHKGSLRMQYCEQAIRTFAPIRSRFHARDSRKDSTENKIEKDQYEEPEISQLVVTTAGDWPSDHYLPGIAGELMGMALWFASMGYGAVHAAAWSEYFPTEAERIMWRFSSVYISCSGALWFAMCMFGFRVKWGSDYWDRFVALERTKLEYAFFGTIATACGCAYILARFFLVIDAIVSLRRLPHNAYDTPDWTVLIPHL